MPSLTVQIAPNGPIIDVSIGVSSARLQAIRAAGQPDPMVIPARMLVDTGASNTNVCRSVIQQLGLIPTGQVQVHTPSTGNTPVSMNQFDVNFYVRLPHSSGLQSNMHVIQTVPVTEADFSAQGIQGLIGRDILAQATMVYHGHMKMITLSF